MAKINIDNYQQEERRINDNVETLYQKYLTLSPSSWPLQSDLDEISKLFETAKRDIEEAQAFLQNPKLDVWSWVKIIFTFGIAWFCFINPSLQLASSRLEDTAGRLNKVSLEALPKVLSRELIQLRLNHLEIVYGKYAALMQTEDMKKKEVQQGIDEKNQDEQTVENELIQQHILLLAMLAEMHYVLGKGEGASIEKVAEYLQSLGKQDELFIQYCALKRGFYFLFSKELLLIYCKN